MPAYAVRPLAPPTWPDFADLVERNGGVWGGCWCMGFHPEGVGRHKSPAQNKAEKQARVEAGTAHAALVFDGAICVGWCQFGPAPELPRIKRARAYAAEAGETPVPDWRITCFYVDKGYRHRGVASAALAGALTEIERLGGGVVESYPEDIEARKVSSSFLHNATVQLFEKQGFTRNRRIGKDHWVVTRTVS